MCENMNCIKKRSVEFLLTLVLNVCLVNAIKIKCSHIDELFAAYPGTQCLSYYRCTSKGHYELKDCNRGEKFDIKSQECLHSSANCVEPICANRGNGVYQDITHGCRRYYTCFSGKVTTIDHCPSQHLHNGFKCVPEEQHICPVQYAMSPVVNDSKEHLCSGKSNGINVDPSSLDCTTYIMCQSGKLQWRKHCSKQAVFNGQQCVPSPLYQCPASIQSSKLLQQDSCYNRNNGLHANAEHGCAAFYRCFAGRMVELNSCNSGQYFDRDSKKCINEHLGQQKRCQEIGIHSDCANRVNGYYSDRTCDSYYYCHAGYKVAYSCSAGRAFNGQNCVSQNEYKCENSQDNEFCLTRNDGYYKDEKDGCRAYKYCSNGNKITYLCEEQQIFDVASKRCVPTSSTSLCTRDTFCLGKSDGYHADLRSNCQYYIYCQHQQRIVYFMCANNYVFNGQQCVPPKQYACPSLYNFRNINCVAKRCLQQCAQDGLFPDIRTNCRDYYFCIGGKPTKSSCPSGQRFNGELCVLADKFTCPTICNGKFENTDSDQCPLKGYFSS